jgi:epoxide hydrolase
VRKSSPGTWCRSWRPRSSVPHARAPKKRSTVPTGVAVFTNGPTKVAIRRFAERENTVVHWSEFDRGGHFATLEAPDLLVGDMREFFRNIR